MFARPPKQEIIYLSLEQEEYKRQKNTKSGTLADIFYMKNCECFLLSGYQLGVCVDIRSKLPTFLEIPAENIAVHEVKDVKAAISTSFKKLGKNSQSYFMAIRWLYFQVMVCLRLRSSLEQSGFFQEFDLTQYRKHNNSIKVELCLTYIFVSTF